MDLHKVYYDSNDVPRTVLQMVKYEPEWAANRIQEGEKAIEQLAAFIRNGVQTKITKHTPGTSSCCGAPIDTSHVIPSGRHMGHGPRYCSKCGRCLFMV